MFVFASLFIALTPTQEQLVLIPAYFFAEVALHETSHALAAKAVGANVNTLIVYPHTQDGTFYFGRTDLFNVEQSDILPISAAPMTLNLLTMTTADLALSKVENKRLGLFLTVALMAVPWVDFTYNINNRRPNSDLSSVSNYSNINKTHIQIAGNVMALYELYRIYNHLNEFLE